MTEENTTRCTGHCCEAFTLPFPPEHLRELYIMSRDHLEGRVHLRMNDDLQLHEPRLIEDIHLIYPMVSYLGHIPTPMAGVEPPSNPEARAHYYTCKHFDRVSRNCTIYEIRPGMCRSYPYSSDCNYAACTWIERKRSPNAKSLEGPADGDIELPSKSSRLAVLID